MSQRTRLLRFSTCMLRRPKASKARCVSLITDIRSLLVCLLIVVLSLAPLGSARAAGGIPGSTDFGFGAAFHSDGPFQDRALAAATTLELDWIYIPISWAGLQPDEAAAPVFDSLEVVMQAAEQQGISVAVSLGQAPVWAQTGSGPDPARTAQFVRLLLERYPGTIRALELFPGANIAGRWGSQPDPVSYMRLFQQINQLVFEDASQVVLVAAGLQPLSASESQPDMDDLLFLEQLYQLGAAKVMPIISLQYAQVSGDPLAMPGENALPVLRHYEKVRNVMSKNHHRNGTIWITQLSMPSGTIGDSSPIASNLDAQAAWLSQAYLQLRAQLYIGAAFLQNLNPDPEGAAAQTPSLILGGMERHPFFIVFQDMILFSKTGMVVPGRPKEGSLEKMRP